MSEDSDRGDGSPDEEIELPVEELAELLDDVRPGFVHRVTASLRRRSLLSQVITFSWDATWNALMEFLEMAFSLFGFDRSNRGEND